MKKVCIITLFNLFFLLGQGQNSCWKEITKPDFGLTFCLSKDWALNQNGNSNLIFPKKDRQIKISLEEIDENLSLKKTFKFLFKYFDEPSYKVICKKFQDELGYTIWKRGNKYFLRLIKCKKRFCYKFHCNSNSLDVLKSTIDEIKTRIYFSDEPLTSSIVKSDSIAILFKEKLSSIMEGKDSLKSVLITSEDLKRDPKAQKFSDQDINYIVNKGNERIAKKINFGIQRISNSFSKRSFSLLEIEVSGVKEKSFNGYLRYDNEKANEQIIFEFVIFEIKPGKLCLVDILGIYNTSISDINPISW